MNTATANANAKLKKFSTLRKFDGLARTPTLRKRNSSVSSPSGGGVGGQMKKAGTIREITEIAEEMASDQYGDEVDGGD